ncbi:response regulator receiver domain [Acinetobacter bereziniae]|uniref:response regulator receiver domain n=1 Tax=Acinetobacter bereziniae TaxID=106648 RepID=UPI0012501D41|nr:response regulator receiver domain [Acinetobacter bereziniae]MBJ9902874.1 transcriptional regulator [Acinetobacter bereziniae]MCU4318426.1 transcriptional regulator [Acinetobacter bereziniae]MCU4597959.1 transcriptional regulator [Acinetobacter bereziniae]
MNVAVDYNSLVTQTFCDNAIRSVMMIDDQFVPYPDLVQSLTNGEKVDKQLLATSQRAANLEKFFQEKHILCDIDNTSSNLNIERIRKSDLLIIDYHLENEDPRKTLEVLSGLKESKHFNLAIVYTSNELNKVWMQIASSFVVAKDIYSQIDEIEDLDVFWSETILPSIEAGSEYSLSDRDLINYLRTGKTKGQIKGLLAQSPFRNSKDKICNLIYNYYIDKFQIRASQNDKDLTILGDENGNKWIKSGNVFVCLYQKSANDIQEDPIRIWETLQQSLVNWEPTYYQLIQSEIQNHIESDSMAFNSIHDNDRHGQAAWLQEILKSKNQTETSQLITNIYADVSEELSFKFNNNSELGRFIELTFNFYKNKFNPEFDTNLAKFCCEQMKLSFNANKTPKDMYHALNMHLSSKNYQNEYISTGTIFKTISEPDETDQPATWYLCVSAACDMIPNQANDPYNDRLTPHRLIRVLKLFPANQENAIQFATHSKYVYVYDNDQRKYFSILNETSNLPALDYMIIKNHADELKRKEIPLMIFTKDHTGNVAIKDIRVKPKSQLRIGYAERYQSIASQHGARIGVDYINSDI